MKNIMKRLLALSVLLAILALASLAQALTPQQYATMLLTGVGGPPAAGGYTAQGVFWSSSLSTSRGAALTGVTDSKVGTLSFWFKAEGSDGTDMLITGQAGGAPLLVQRLASGVMRVLCENAAASIILLASTSTNTFNVGDGWKHVLSSWNLATKYNSDLCRRCIRRQYIVQYKRHYCVCNRCHGLAAI